MVRSSHRRPQEDNDLAVLQNYHHQAGEHCAGLLSSGPKSDHHHNQACSSIGPTVESGATKANQVVGGQIFSVLKACSGIHDEVDAQLSQHHKCYQMKFYFIQIVLCKY
ncbi:hypothetical protein VPH35_088557 [Triticum aestivum]